METDGERETGEKKRERERRPGDFEESTSSATATTNRDPAD